MAVGKNKKNHCTFFQSKKEANLPFFLKSVKNTIEKNKNVHASL